MTPEEKAKELVEKLKWYCDGTAMGAFRSEVALSNAKQCALIAVEQIENALIDCGELSDQLQNMDRELNFWQNVRKTIETL